jgi:hypothetical protein
MAATAGVFLDSWLTYAAKDTPTGNLTVTLSNGYKISIPPEELFYVPRGYNDDGKYEVLDTTYKIAMMVNTTDDGYVKNWGIPFLTMNYVIGDYQRNQFKMAPAIRTDFSKTGTAGSSLSNNLKASCDPTTKSTPTPTSGSDSDSTDVSASGATGSSSSSNNNASSAADKDKAVNTGAIVGGVVGGVL